MQPEFIKNIHALVLDSEGKAWQFRNGQDQEKVAAEVANKILKQYRGNVVANAKYTGNGAYSKLDAQERALIDMMIMEDAGKVFIL